jgi:hypothetical protein
MVFLDDLDNPQEEANKQSDLIAEPQTRMRHRGNAPADSGMLFDAFSLLLIVGAVIVLVAAFLIFRDPYTPLNPYPPETPIPTLYIPSATPSPTEPARLPGTWTATITSTPTNTLTPTATLTLTPTDTGTPPPPTPTIPNTAFNYLLRGSPAYLSGSVMHPDDTCKLWIAGQAFDMKGSPVIGITVELGGTLNYKDIYLLSLTGTALQYGPGGYEFVLADTALASNETVWVQLLNQEMVAISERVYFNTFEGCEKNLVLINFKQVK